MMHNDNRKGPEKNNKQNCRMIIVENYPNRKRTANFLAVILINNRQKVIRQHFQHTGSMRKQQKYSIISDSEKGRKNEKSMLKRYN